MRKLYTVAFPTLSEEDGRFIAGIRAAHDRQASVLGPHFTLLFGCAAVDAATYIEHVRTVAAATPAFAFTCFEAAPDDDEGRGYAYLLPDLGRAELTALHDRLYTGPMAPHLRQDLHFVAHMTIGHAADFDAAALLCDELNAQGINVAGSIDALVWAAWSKAASSSWRASRCGIEGLAQAGWPACTSSGAHLIV